MKYITYLTIYTGDKLPPFYIGSTYLDKPKVGKFAKESVKRGFPEGSYKNIVMQFERKSND